MGQHLQLYASKSISVSQARTWCRARLIDQLEPPPFPFRILDEIQAVSDEISNIDRSLRADRLEHWSNGHGVSCFRMFDHDAHLCDESLIEAAIASGMAYNEFLQRNWANTAAAKIDWSNDDLIAFLRSHIGYVVWGYNDGI